MIKTLFISLILILFFGLASVQAQDCVLTVGLHDDSSPCIHYEGYLTVHNTGVSGYYSETNTESYGVYVDFEGAGFVIYGRAYEFSPPLVFGVYSDFVPDYFETYPSTAIEGDMVTEVYRFEGVIDFGLWHMDYDVNNIDPEADLFFTFDAIEILAAPSVIPPSPTNTPDPTFYYFDILTEEGTQTVSLQYNMTAGDVFVGMGLFALVTLMSISLIVWLWKR